MHSLYFRFIQFSLGIYEGKEFLDGTALCGFDWALLYRFAKKQMLLGCLWKEYPSSLRRWHPSMRC